MKLDGLPSTIMPPPGMALTLTEGFPWDDLRKILHEGQRMASVHSGREIAPKASTPLVEYTNNKDRQMTDRPICDSKYRNVT